MWFLINKCQLLVPLETLSVSCCWLHTHSDWQNDICAQTANMVLTVDKKKFSDCKTCTVDLLSSSQHVWHTASVVNSLTIQQRFNLVCHWALMNYVWQTTWFRFICGVKLFCWVDLVFVFVFWFDVWPLLIHALLWIHYWLGRPWRSLIQYTVHGCMACENCMDVYGG